MGEIPDAILLKPGYLTPDERWTIRTHCTLGDAILAPLERQSPVRTFLTMARQIVLGHHEKWNGCGYPQGLAGASIPLAARMMSVVDTYDALRSRHTYQEARSHEECVQVLSELAGIHYDPAIIKAFLRIEPEFARLSQMSSWIDSY
jgi:putative two-component system response regulator